MKIKALKHDFSICKVKTLDPDYLKREFCFVSKTEEELSLVCQTEYVPTDVIECDNGWRAFRIQGILDFSLIGILAPIAKILADNKIGIFAVSTYNTDYILVKKESFDKALAVLSDKGYTVL